MNNTYGIKQIISGGAAGADSLAERWAKEHQIEIIIYRPDWKQYGKGAGIERNRQMVKDCDWCIAFWDGKSKGTNSAIEYSRRLNKKLTVIRYPV